MIEILISLLILSGTVIALLTAFSTSISASSQYRGLVVNDTVLRAVSEQVVGLFQEGGVYQSCESASQYAALPAVQQALLPPAPYSTPGDYVATLTNVQYWDGSSYGPTCVSGSTLPQLLTLSLNGPLSSTKTIDFVVEGSGQLTNGVKLAAPTNVTPSTPTAAGESGTLTVTFVGSSNAPVGQTYSVQACTDSLMSVGCAPPIAQFQSGGEISGLVPGTNYYVSVTANASSGYAASDPVQGGPAMSSGTLNLPAVTSVAPSTSTAGALVVTFSTPSTISGPYTVTGCTDSAMTQNCVSQSSFISGQDFTGLATSRAYYVEVAPTTYPGESSLPYSPAVTPTVQLLAPANVSAAPSSQTAGALVVTFPNSANAPSSQTYTVTGCTDQAMTQNCVSQSSFISGSALVGLNSQTPTAYWVTVVADKSTGYLVSPATQSSSAVAATVQLAQPVITSVGPGTSTGQIIVTIQAPSVEATNQTYTLLACNKKNSGHTQVCQTTASYVPGTSVDSWTSGQTVYVTATANASTGYLASIPSTQVSGKAK